MRKRIGSIGLLVGTIVAVAAVALTSTPADAGRGNGPIIFVTSQGLYFDSIVTANPVPWEGPFQPLGMGANGLETNAGPGDTNYVGGRWWMDSNGNGEMDSDDHYFVCPLLPPGRSMP